MQPLKNNLLDAKQRLRQYDTSPLIFLAACVFALAVLQLAVLLITHNYHAGFSTLNPLLNSLLPDFLWAWITRFGDERVLLAFCLLFARRHPEIIWALLLTSLLALLYAKGIKAWFDTTRPPGVLDLQTIKLVGPALRANSYPSGHTTTAFVFFGVLCAFTGHTHQRIALLACASLVGLSRIAIGIHWPIDVLAGALGGLGAAVLGVWWAKHWLGGLNPGAHFGVIGLACIGMVSLLFVDGGNPSTPVLIYAIVFAMFWQLVLDYYPFQSRSAR